MKGERGGRKEKREEKIAGGRRVMNNTWLPVYDYRVESYERVVVVVVVGKKCGVRGRRGKNSRGRVVYIYEHNRGELKNVIRGLSEDYATHCGQYFLSSR